MSATVPVPDRFDLVVEAHQTTRAVELIWRRQDEVGVRFATRRAGDVDDSLSQLAVAFGDRPANARLH